MQGWSRGKEEARSVYTRPVGRRSSARKMTAKLRKETQDAGLEMRVWEIELRCFENLWPGHAGPG